ncbi:STM4014 family protein [Paenibacillus sp. M.A.Huq-81]
MILIGNAGNRRTQGLQSARLKLGLPLALELNYLDLLRGTISLSSFIEVHRDELPENPLIRLDAPGEHFEVERELIALGAPDAAGQEDIVPPLYEHYCQPVSMKNAWKIEEQRGRIYHPSQWFRGFYRLLRRLETEAEEIWPRPSWINAPRDIAVMFDKRRTYTTLLDAGVPVPKRLGSPAEITNYETLRELMKVKRMPRVFVKLASGSGACGVIAYQINPATGAELAVTTIAFESYTARPPVYYNVKRLKRYTDSATIRNIVNWLLCHGAHVEGWVAKAAIHNRAFDIRQLVVDGEACHSVARVSSTPITNLHLQSERMGLDAVGLSNDAQHAIKRCAEAALNVFQGSRIAGIDIAVSAGAGRPFVLDVNPFGDLLYETVYRGCTTYEWETLRLKEASSGDGKEGSHHHE